MAEADVHRAVALVLDGRADAVPEGIVDGSTDDLRLLALRAVFERQLLAKQYDDALVTAKQLLAAEPDNAAHLIRKG